MAGQQKTAVVAGYGTGGISAAFSRRFGRENFKFALLSRTPAKLEAAVEELGKEGITAKAFPTDLSDAAAVKSTIAAVHSEFGPIDLLFFNPISVPASLLTATPEQVTSALNVTTTGLIAAVQAAHADLKQSQGAVLVTGGGLALEDDAMATAAMNLATLAVAKAAQRKLVHIMHKALAADGIYAAEVTVCGGVKRAGDEAGSSEWATITPESVADDFWELWSKREPGVWFVKRVP